MRIGIDAIGIEKASGGRTLVVNLLNALFKLDKRNQYIVVVSSHEPMFDTLNGNVTQLLLPLRNRFLKRIVGQIVFPYWTRKCDIVHFTKNLSFFGPMPPAILTIFDLSMLKFSGLMPRSDLFYWRTVQKYAAHAADHIITLSHNAANDIHTLYGVPMKKIRVIYLGVAPYFVPANIDEIKKIRKKYGLPEEFIVHVGRIDPIKNIPSLVQAFSLLKKRNRYEGKLVLVGEMYRKIPDLELIPKIKEEGLNNEVILTGYVADNELPAIYSAARMKVFPSHNEGFGLVPLEAMACGTPVVVHRAGGAVEEVVGDAGIVTDRNDPETLYDAIIRLLSDKDLENRLRKASIKRASEFKWENTANQTLELYEEVHSNEGFIGQAL